MAENSNSSITGEDGTRCNVRSAAGTEIPAVAVGSSRGNDRLADEAFREFSKLAQRAQETRDVSDGIAAGRAWGRFLMHFHPAQPSPSNLTDLSEVRRERARA